MNRVALDDFAQNGWHVDSELYNALNSAEREFLQLELLGSRTLDYYRNRLQACGFTGHQQVLDAACGAGQWSIALAELNAQVSAVDINTNRIGFGQSLAQNHGLHNLDFRYASIEALPFPDAHFDAVFCYGALMFTHTQRSLQEFFRVLKPGGRLYVNVNGYGWGVYLLTRRFLNNPSWPLLKGTLQMALNTLLGRVKKRFFSQKMLRQSLRCEGFIETHCDREGKVILCSEALPFEPAYQEQHWGLDCVIECVSTKPVVSAEC